MWVNNYSYHHIVVAGVLMNDSGISLQAGSIALASLDVGTFCGMYVCHVRCMYGLWDVCMSSKKVPVAFQALCMAMSHVIVGWE